mmetsp:Transcript_20763/g.20864  ORF Transcript_20763/g.20864 Transcript_20763/m.20864 type:complete len:141 (+) Transcript_20763:450-872(+)
MFPAVADAVVPIYNIPDILAAGGSIALSRSMIARIFSGSITMWNDMAIVNGQIEDTTVRNGLINLAESNLVKCVFQQTVRTLHPSSQHLCPSLIQSDLTRSVNQLVRQKSRSSVDQKQMNYKYSQVLVVSILSQLKMFTR